MTDRSDLAGKRVTVMGLGRFGGGAGAARWLCAQGANVLVTDLEPPERLREGLASLADLADSHRLAFHLGGHDERHFTDTDLVVANPAAPAPWSNRFLAAARAANVPVTTEIGLLVHRLPNPSRVIGVTGTVGKSTTTAMIGHVLSRALAARARAERMWLGGNIGGSLLRELPVMTPQDWIVLELSSAMLFWLGEAASWSGAPPWSPAVAALTNFAPNHMDWHGTMEHYRASKEAILGAQPAPAIAVSSDWPGAGEALRRNARWTPIDPAERTRIDHAMPDLLVPGRHNRANARLALRAVAAAIDDDPAQLAHLLADFTGLPHRLRLVAEIEPPSGRGLVRCYDDSKSTTPESTIIAVRAFDADGPRPATPVHLIAGGYDKKIDLTPIAALAPSLAGLYTIGATGPAIARAAHAAGAASTTHPCETLDRAVAHAIANARAGHAIVLSPGCASWDQFANYEERAATFARLIADAARPAALASKP